MMDFSAIIGGLLCEGHSIETIRTMSFYEYQCLMSAAGFRAAQIEDPDKQSGDVSDDDVEKAANIRRKIQAREAQKEAR